MRKLLLKCFVKNTADGTDPKTRAQVGRLSGAVGIVCNVLLCIGKLLIGTLSGSVSITADAMNNLSDSASSLITLVGFKIAEKPADEDHPYGHARFEYLSGLAVAALILVIGVDLAKTSVGKIFAPQAVLVTWPLVIVLAASIAVKLWMAGFNRQLGSFIDSAALLAAAADSRNDVISTGAVLAAALVEKFTGFPIDGYMGLAVAVFILYSGVMMGKDTISPLLGEAANPQLQQLIAATICSEPKVLGFHDLMVHDYGPGQRFASLHVEMDSREDPIDCHDLIDDLERLCLEKHNVHLVIHYDPVVIDDPEQNALKQTVGEALRQLDERITFHDFRMVRGTGHTNLVFDVAVSPQWNGRHKELRQALREAIAKNHQGTYYIVVTFDSQAFN